jgi:hypothetical protein
LLNIIAGTLSTGAPPVAPSSYESIATVTVGSGGASSIDFNSIPSSYTHLQVRYIGRESRAVALDALRINFNGSTASEYRQHLIYGDGSTAGAANNGSLTATIEIGDLTGASAGANIFAAGVFDILDYANTNKNKTIRSLTGQDLNGSGLLVFWSGLWVNTTAINSITLRTAQAGNNFVQYSSFALYGIKGA